MSDMARFHRAGLAAVCLLGMTTAATSGQPLEDDVGPLVRESCVRCHGVRTVTPLNLVDLGYDLSDRETFRTWEKVYERLERGEMPPSTAPRPKAASVESALGALRQALSEASLVARGEQRGALRRLTRLEYANTVSDLLGVDPEIGTELSLTLPAEADSGGFDTVAANQSMSPLHVRSYLAAADEVLDVALVTGPPPPVERYEIDYATSERLYRHSQRIGLGAGMARQLDDAYVAFFDYAATYTFHSEAEGVSIPYPGRYRVSVEAYRYQAETPVALKIYRGLKAGVASTLNDLIGWFDLTDDETVTVEVMPFLRPGHLIGVAPDDADGDDDPALAFEDRSQGYREVLKTYEGEGIAFKTMTIEGPLLESWPPRSTRDLLPGVGFDHDGYVQFAKAPFEHVVDAVAAFAPRAFRRPVDVDEVMTYASLARPVLEAGRPFIEAVRVPLRAILSAPSFLYLSGESASPHLDDVELATRLSYFLWRSHPDSELSELAVDGRLQDPAVLVGQVDRLLNDPRSRRFVNDFLGQAFRLYEMTATNPDPGLYPEFDDRLGQAMVAETQLFLAELIAEDLSAANLIDADFTFVNRPLAEHYGLPGILGTEMRKVPLPADSPRGGLLSQSSVLKITANGTNTSPIPRGNFVLENLLGRPAPPPPAEVGALEPDTRGTITIREQLDAHRKSPTCANCHRVIDPPGFALESFDPIGGFRTSYRISGGQKEFGSFIIRNPYLEGPSVDSSGVTPDGMSFSGFVDYKQHLLDRELDAVARHLVSQLIVFSTGADTAFADRVWIDAIVDAEREAGYPVRSLIHRIVASDLFRQR
ncbi:MAG: hypothetical protein CL483_05660 [Acidobacteria bacterium]|nr:hypothetical protein [Acidobacteriota bacterium]